MNTKIIILNFLALTVFGITLVSCGEDGNSAADKAAAAYYEEKLKSESDGLGLTLEGPAEKWEPMEISRKMGVKGKVMHITLGFFHEKNTHPIGKQFILYNDGKDWKVLSMYNGAYLDKQMQQQFGKSIDKDKIKTTQFGPAEQVALDDWLKEFANWSETGQTDYGEFLDCFVESGSERWRSKDGGHVILKVYHENKSTEHVAFIKKQEDGSWKAKD